MAKLIDDIKEDTVDATRRIVKIAEETNKIGVTAIETLDKQGEQIHAIKGNVNEIGASLNDAEKSVEKLEHSGLCGCCTCCSKGDLKKSRRKWVDSLADASSAITSQPKAHYKIPNASGGQSNKPDHDDDRDKEIDENLEQIDHLVDNLHGIAVDFKDELTRQNKELENINKDVAEGEANIKEINQRVRGKVSQSSAPVSSPSPSPLNILTSLT